MDQLIAFFNDAERFFNQVGYIPIVSIAGGLLRIVMGSLQVLVTAWALLFALIWLVITYVFRSTHLSKQSMRVAQLSLRIITNGRMNIGRGVLEVVPLIGNGLCFLYDRARREEMLVPYRPGT